MSSSASSTPLETPINTLGATLMQLRQAKGVSLNELSARTKYSTAQLEALEQDNWEDLPSGVPLRWMVKNCARALNTNEESLLVLLGPQHGQAPQHSARTDMRKGASWGESALHSETGQRSWGWWLIILVLILVSLGYALNQGWIPENWLVFDWLKEFRS